MKRNQDDRNYDRDQIFSLNAGLNHQNFFLVRSELSSCIKKRVKLKTVVVWCCYNTMNDDYLQGKIMIKENSYFDGNVKSLGFQQNENQITVGVMAVGEYTFGTDAPERMTVIKGALTVKRSTDADWVTFQTGEEFDVEGQSSFDLQVAQATAYLCEYL